MSILPAPYCIASTTRIISMTRSRSTGFQVMPSTFKAVPTRDQILPDINEALVVELYSK